MRQPTSTHITIHATDQPRVVTRYPDGCETAFPVGALVTLEEIARSHDDLHAKLDGGKRAPVWEEAPDSALGRCPVMLQCHRETGHAGAHEAKARWDYTRAEPMSGGSVDV